MGPVTNACFFLYSGESLSSGFCCWGGVPAFRAEEGPAGFLAAPLGWELGGILAGAFACA